MLCFMDVLGALDRRACMHLNVIWKFYNKFPIYCHTDKWIDASTHLDLFINYPVLSDVFYTAKIFSFILHILVLYCCLVLLHVVSLPERISCSAYKQIFIFFVPSPWTSDELHLHGTRTKLCCDVTRLYLK